MKYDQLYRNADKEMVTQDEYKNHYGSNSFTDFSFNIYDLRTGAIVWSGTIERDGSRRNEYIDKKESKFFLIALIDCILESRPEYPEPSSLDVLLRLIFTSFAKNLPKEE